MGLKQSKIESQFYNLIKQYSVLSEDKNNKILQLKHKSSKQSYLLKEFNFDSQQEESKKLEYLHKQKLCYQSNKSIFKINSIVRGTEKEYCSTLHKLYVLMESSEKTLNDQVNQRRLQKNRFKQNQLWSILASCILGLSHLQKSGIMHCKLKSNTIHISDDGFIKIYDTTLLGVRSNYEEILVDRSIEHIYLSPQLTESLLTQIAQPINSFKNDIWTLGMIIVQAGLLQYQDECYRDDFTRIHWQTLKYNLKVFEDYYSSDLSKFIFLMLDRDGTNRPDWLELVEYVNSIDQNFRNSFTQQIQQSLVQIKVNQDQRKYRFSESFVSNKSKQGEINSKNITIKSQQADNASNDGQKYLRITNISPIAPSNISATRPLRNIFPSSFYVSITSIDQNLLVQSQNTKQNSQNIIKLLKIQETYQQTKTKQDQRIIQSQKLKYVVQNYLRGSKYQGFKRNHLREGYGKFYYEDGGFYEGNWHLDKMEGQGKLYYQSGELAYEGSWIDDNFSGQGILYNEKPDSFDQPFDYKYFDNIQSIWIKYEGQFVKDYKQGKGTLFLSNGQYFQGYFKDNLVEGYGVYTTMQGNKISGVWKQNILIKKL